MLYQQPSPPNGKAETLGLTRLDEPGPHQTDPTVLDLHLVYITKETNMQVSIIVLLLLLILLRFVNILFLLCMYVYG